MTTRKRFSKRITSIFLVFSLLLTMLPLIAPSSAAATANGNCIADPSTMDSWKDFFSLEGDISTENAGRVWMDKSVFTDASAFAGTGISQSKSDSFLVALSTIAANMSITGVSHVPTDTMLILDVSGSMSDNYSDVAEDLVNATNESIATLLSTNKYNRVGVVLYSGSTTGNNYNGAAITVLPLDRYTTGSHGHYLQYTITGSYSTTETISVNKDVRIEETKKAPPSASKNVVGSTYIQRGVITAMESFLTEDNDIIIEDPIMGTLRRKPVIVLMSDGSPTLGSVDFTDPGYDSYYEYELGDGLDTSPAIGFVSQLSAAYVKAKVQEKYDAKPLFYTLGLGVSGESIATGVLDPDNEDASPELGKLWDKYNAAGATSVKLNSYYSVKVIDTPLEENYVDRYFAADGSSGSLSAELAKAFREIVSTIQLQTMYSPTLVSGNNQLSGYISFVDKVGQYMEVTDVKGILIDNKLFSGADLASNFVAGGGYLGTYDNPTELGLEMVASVRARLGIDSDETARALISLAYEHGQLSYTDKNNYSNYIGWYANKAGKFLGFYHKGTTVLPAPTGDPETDPAFVVKSYGYLGAVDQRQGVAKSDMMYATVQVREEIATGTQLVTFAVPASLIPVISYHVKLDSDDALESLTVDGANAPIRLVYEISLDESINSFNAKDVLPDEYLADPHNVNSDGSVNFYTSQWDHQNTTGYGTVNTYSYFNPSRQNDRYYYLEDTPVYADTNGTLYTGSAHPSDADTLYSRFTVYDKGNSALSIDTVYREFSSEVKATAIRNDDGTWYIPKGNVRVNLDGYTVAKTENRTETLTDSNIPFVDTHNHQVNDVDYNFYVGATLGNNGKFVLVPETGLRLTKTMADGVAAPNDAFTFHIYNETDPYDGRIYKAFLVQADGTEKDVNVYFDDGNATVELKVGDALYIGGMQPGHTFRIEEQETLEYTPSVTGLTASGTVTVIENVLSPVTFINDARGTGSLTVSKTVDHDYGTDYQIPADKRFTMQVTLSGIGTASTTFNTTAGTVTTDENGQFTFQLSHGQQYQIMGLPTGTVATVKELDPPAGFTPAYWENGAIGDGQVTISKNTAVSVEVVNDYQSAPVKPNITVSGEKLLNGRDWKTGDSFSFKLEKRLADGSWVQLGSIATASFGSTAFAFADAFKDELYTQTGVYDYRVTEITPENPLGGMSYDKTVYTFSVHVTDSDMDGQLEIQKVTSNNATVTATANGWNVATQFTNTYSADGSATVTIDVNKHIENIGGAEKSLAGFTFGLFDSNGMQIGKLLSTDEQGFVRFVLSYDAAQIGNGNHSYTYVLKEIAPDPVPAGWTYSKETVTVKVDVTDNGDGSISAVIYTGAKPANAGTSIGADFTNIYDPANAELAIDFVNKELTGRELRDGEFDFEVQLPDGTTVLKGTNNASGKVVFDGKLHFDKVGTYIYNVVETSQDGNGIITDKTVHRVTVTVTDVNGKLQAEYALTAGTTVTFRNTYSAGSVDHTLRGTKTLLGRTLLNDEFTFILTDGSQSWTTKNFADGSFAFPAITYTKAGTYVYTVKEDILEGGKAYGVTYDQTQCTVTVVIKDDGEGKLYVASETVADADSLHFQNTYEPAPTQIQLTGDKQLTGKITNALTGGEFAFILYNSDASWTLGKARETVRNGANGTITFQKIDFNKVGDQYFIVAEKDGGKTIDGITYDDTLYRVWVEVTDDLQGQLHATVHIYDGNGVPQNRIVFRNIYEVTGGATVTLSGEKCLEGRDFLETDSFSFRLYDENDLYATAAMDPVTHRYQFTLNYTPADIGRTFRYTLKETNGGQTIDGITYSNTQYQIQVAVEDDGKGGIRTTVTTDLATASTLDFVNKYQAAPTHITLDGSKEFSGQPLVDGAFAFELTETGKNFHALEGIAPMVVRNDAGGKFTFGRIDLDTIQTRYFTVTEQNAGATIDGITYDATVYRIRIEVTDDLKGQLHATVHIEDGQGNPQNSILFRNTYEVTGGAAVTLSGEKYLEGRDFLAQDDFTFRLYSADGSFITAGMDPVTHRYQFTLNYTPADVGQTFSYILKETNAGETINGVTYSDVEYRIEVTVEDNGKGGIRTATTTDQATTSTLNFVNKYHADPAYVTIEGTKELTGRDLMDGEFKFLMAETDAAFTVAEGVIPMVTYNDANGKFSFDTLTFTEVGTYYFVIAEDDTVDAERVTFDDAVYHVTIAVTDDLHGNLVTEVTIQKANSTDFEGSIGFNNVFTPRPEDITVNIDINKVVHNTGTESIGPEGFTFLLDDGLQSSTVLSDSNGKAGFTLTFTEDDLGKTFHYTLSEVNCGKDNVTYSTAVYTIDITISLDELTNTLVATLVQNEVETDALTATFENTYHLVIEEEIPVTGSDLGLVHWMALMFTSSGAILALLMEDQKRRNKNI